MSVNANANEIWGQEHDVEMVNVSVSIAFWHGEENLMESETSVYERNVHEGNTMARENEDVGGKIWMWHLEEILAVVCTGHDREAMGYASTVETVIADTYPDISPVDYQAAGEGPPQAPGTGNVGHEGLDVWGRWNDDEEKGIFSHRRRDEDSPIEVSVAHDFDFGASKIHLV